MKDNLTILDLINKIAYNEEIPSLIKVFGVEWTWSDEFCDYEILRDSDLDKFESSFLFRLIFRESSKYEDKYSLNEIVYLLDTEIEKLPKNITDNVCNSIDFRTMANKINELIDEVNKLKEVNHE